jgi:heme oxygenase (biliverdin-producing, ferredoxin)
MGDLSGGQIIRRRIAKAYDLDPASGLGTQFYEFQKLGGGGVAGVGDMRHIKVWYRDGMNKGVGDNQQRKGGLSQMALVWSDSYSHWVLQPFYFQRQD